MLQQEITVIIFRLLISSKSLIMKCCKVQLPFYTGPETNCLRSYTPIGEGWGAESEVAGALKLTIKKYEKGQMSPLLADLKSGDKITLSGPYGNFQLQKVKGNFTYAINTK